MSASINNDQNLELLYTLFCDDVRLEVGNKLSFMGVFQNLVVQQHPFNIIKFAVVNHWQGQGNHQTEVRILSPDKNNMVVTSQPTTIELAEGGFTDNVSFFVNVVFSTAGTYWIQTIANTAVVDEFPLIVTDQNNMEALRPADEITETVN